jgi:hypothetical protein
LEAQEVPVNDVVDSFEVKVREDDRGRRGRLPGCGAGENREVLRDVGDKERLLSGGGVPEGVEWPDRRSSHIIDSQHAQE